MKKTLHILTVIKNIESDSGHGYTKTKRVGLAFFKNASGGMTAMQVGGLYQDIEPESGENNILEQLGVFGVIIKETPLNKSWAEYILDNLAQINLCGKGKSISLLKFFRRRKSGDEVDMLWKLLHITANREFEAICGGYKIIFKITGTHKIIFINKKSNQFSEKSIFKENRHSDWDFLVAAELALRSLK